MELPDPETLKQAKLHNTFGSVCLRAQRVDRAMPHLIKAVELIPNGFTNAYFNLGNGYAQSKDSENAIKYFEKAIEESPHRQPDCEVPIDDCWNNLGALIEAHTNLAVMYMIENRLEEALEQCEKSIALQPKGEGAEAHINMGNVLRTLNSRESAIDHVWIQVAFLAGKEGKPFTRPELLDVKAHPLPEHDGELHVVCVKWGTKYGADYVNKLYHGVEKFLTLPHKFICFTEDSSGLDEGILVTPLAEDWTGWWGKATLFGDTGYTGRMLYIDLDTVITGSLDDLASYKGAFAVMSTADIWCEMAKDGFNSSIISWHTSFGS